MKKLFYLVPFLLVAALQMPVHAQVSIQSGDLIKSDANTAVYYLAADGKRYVFATDKTYFTWYANFSTVKTISAGDLAALPLGGNVTYKPGVKMLKIQSDPRVYAVSKNGILRAIGSEAVATALYGSTWNKQIDDLPDAFFTNYKVGEPIEDAAGYDKAILKDAVPSINVDKLLAAPPAGFVDIRHNSGFFPNSLIAAPNTKITWIALDDSLPYVASDPHPTHTDLPGLSSSTLHMGETYSFTFTQAGDWGYHNHNAPSQTGSVTVQ